MKPKIDWPNHIVSFFLIIFSILSAFQLERCSEEQRERDLVNSHLTALVEETRFNKANLEGTIRYMESNRPKLDTLLQLITTEGDVQTINQLVFGLLNMGGLYLKKNAYESFIQSGDIRFLKDFDQKSEVINLYEYYKLAEINQQIILDNYNKAFWEHLRKNADLYQRTPQKLEVYQSRTFVNALASYRYLLDNCLRVYKEAVQKMGAFIEKNESIVRLTK